MKRGLWKRAIALILLVSSVTFMIIILGRGAQIAQGAIYAIGAIATSILMVYGSKLAQKTLEETL
ncbi:hypothetical protein [Roseofilum capinflatum]|uniref:Uncharacterized protein n=1 Tax=Roseofilum capinflatum BLCC-M114 TaxID=3022440 RepID=A0ABT7B3L5_9CYAN|nr:hypothetical protein [Roseofilum capinflatum]MDJ1173774.1 hypothetical protein [Roseofilum capinflatum BLCC-M114]